MKLFSLLMSFVLFALMAIPCQDTRSCTNEPVYAVSQGHRHAEKFHLDGCSPMCACACCASTAIRSGSLVSSTLIPHSNVRFHYQIVAVYDYHAPVWQPPQA